MRQPSSFALLALTALTALAGLGLVPAPPPGAPELCGPVMTLVRPVVGEPLCTHGDDPHLAPAGAAGGGNRADGPIPDATVRCYGDGRDGARVEVLSLRPAGSRGASPADVRRWARQVEWVVSASAARWDAQRHVRWLTEAGANGRCRVAIRDVVLSGAELADFSRMVSALRSRGFDRGDRKYLLFVEDDTYCGLASAPRDDRLAPDNAAERRAGYARIDRPCWTGGDAGFSSVAAHELMHNLGAVQDSAPNAHGTAHCHDEWDVLCYADGGGTMQMQCRDDRGTTSGAGDHFNRLLDCNGDDYFHPDPPPGSYLSTHWNVADSRFLEGKPRRRSTEPPSGSPGSATASGCVIGGVFVRSPLVCSTVRG